MDNYTTSVHEFMTKVRESMSHMTVIETPCGIKYRETPTVWHNLEYGRITSEVYEWLSANGFVFSHHYCNTPESIAKGTTEMFFTRKPIPYKNKFRIFSELRIQIFDERSIKI